MKCEANFFPVFLLKLMANFPLFPAAEVFYTILYALNKYSFFVFWHTAALFKDCDNQWMCEFNS